MGEELIVNPEPTPGASANALLEAAAIDARKLKRDDRADSHRHVGTLVCWWAFVLIGLSIAGLWTWNLVASPAHQFWTDAQRIEVQNVLIVILGSSAVTKASERWLK